METTLNIRTDIMYQISRSAKAHGMCCSELIVILLKKVMKDIGNPDCMGMLVQYQARRRPEEWHTFHIKWKEYDYEYFQDLRRLLKKSISLLLAHAVRKFLSKKNKINRNDNYLYVNYSIIKELINNITSWRFIWGYSPPMIK